MVTYKLHNTLHLGFFLSIYGRQLPEAILLLCGLKMLNAVQQEIDVPLFETLINSLDVSAKYINLLLKVSPTLLSDNKPGCKCQVH